MKRIALAAFALVALAASAIAQVIPPGTNPVPVGAAYNSSALTCTSGQACWLQVDVNGNLLTSSSGTPAPPVGASNFSTSQVSVATSSTATVAARTARRSVTITNVTGTQQVYCSGTTATTANGQLIPAAVGANYTVSTAAAINCIAVSGAQTVSVAETF